MNRITEMEAELYIPLTPNDPLIAKKAVAFTVTPTGDFNSFTGAEWHDVTYYTDNITNPVSPLEIMLNEWKYSDK